MKRFLQITAIAGFSAAMLGASLQPAKAQTPGYDVNGCGWYLSLIHI